MVQFANSRQLAPRLRKLLNELETVSAHQYGARNKTAAYAIELGFASRVSRNHKHVVVEITDRGRQALERQSRGVDPYLTMTA